MDSLKKLPTYEAHFSLELPVYNKRNVEMDCPRNNVG